jgi:predicted nucleic acid-binding protein
MDLTVISNTTPIITLLAINKFDLLRQLFGEICVPYGVYQEIEDGKHKPFYTYLPKHDWIKIKTVSNDLALQQLEESLDRGEAQAIILYQEMEADLLILDERLGTKYAKARGCKVTGSYGILLRAKELGLIDKIKPLLLEARSKQIFIGDKLFDLILEKANEK